MPAAMVERPAQKVLGYSRRGKKTLLQTFHEVDLNNLLTEVLMNDRRV